MAQSMDGSTTQPAHVRGEVTVHGRRGNQPARLWNAQSGRKGGVLVCSFQVSTKVFELFELVAAQHAHERHLVAHRQPTTGIIGLARSPRSHTEQKHSLAQTLTCLHTLRHTCTHTHRPTHSVY